MKAYPSYQDSGVEWLGGIPSHWEVVKLKHIGKAFIGLTYNPDNVTDEENGKLVLRASNVQGGKITLDDNVYVKMEIPERLITKVNDILICVRSGSRDLIGKNALIDEKSAGFSFGAFMTVFRSEINNYLVYVFNSQLFKVQSGLFNTSTVNQLTQNDLYNFQVAIPPIPEQQAIADFLDRKTAQIDALIEKKQRQIDLLQEQRTALINHAVTKGLNPKVKMKDSGVEWLGEIPSHWEVVRVKHLADSMISGPFGSSLTKDMYTSEGYRVYGQEQVIPADFSIGDYYISKEKYLEMERYAVFTGDVLISCVGTFGKIAVVPEGIEPGIINPRLIKVSPNRKAILPEYLGEVLSSKVTFDQLEEVNRGGTMGVINLGLLSDILIPIPPIDEQIEIKSFVNKTKANTNRSHQNIIQMLELLSEYRTALISEAVTGKVDVRTVHE